MLFYYLNTSSPTIVEVLWDHLVSKPTPFEVSQTLAKRHRALRRQLKMSQSEMAERSGVSLGSLKRFDSQVKISLESFLKLVYLLGRLEEFNHLLHPTKTWMRIRSYLPDIAASDLRPTY